MKSTLVRRVMRQSAMLLSLFLLAIASVAEANANSSRYVTSAWSMIAGALQDVPVPVDKEIAVFGQKIHYVEVGSGPPVILLHGLGGSTQNWALNFGPLSKGFHVFIPDQIGFGTSDKPLINYRIATYVDFLDQFCKLLKIERATLVGGSMGGWVAAAFAIAFPDRVDRLVLVDAAGYAPPVNFDYRTLYGLNPSSREGMKQLAGRIFFNKAFATDQVIDQFMAQRIGAGDGYTINMIIASIIRGEDSLDNRVEDIKQPTLIVWGREDGLIPLSDGQRFKKEIPNSTLVVIEQCGHVPNFEKAAEFNTVLLKFLNSGVR
jgi:2-hydroxy-6-oxonona-2,4-dienedioate hydrolase